MKLTIERDSLLNGLNAVLDIVPSRTALPVLSNLLLETGEDGGIRLCATDLDISIVCSVPAAVEEVGSTTVPARKFAEIVREMPDESMVLDATGYVAFDTSVPDVAEYAARRRIIPRLGQLVVFSLLFAATASDFR